MPSSHKSHLLNPHPPMDPNPTLSPPPPPSSPSTSYTSFPILALSIVGILTTAILLVSYYVFVIKCCLNWRRSDLLRLSTTRSLRHNRHPNPPSFQSTAITEPRGLGPSSIRSIPTFRFTKLNGNSGPNRIAIECAVCLTEFQEEERLRLLPNCSHAFHIDCIDTWLQSNANCPLCRSDITDPLLLPIPTQFLPEILRQDSGSVVIEVRDGGNEQSTTPRAIPSPRKSEQRKKGRKFDHVASMGDECIDVRGGKDDQFKVQPIRRSFSMDSSNDRQLYVSVQEILQRNPHLFREVGSGEGSSSSAGGSGRVRRSFFSFGHGRSSRNAVIRVQSEL